MKALIFDSGALINLSMNGLLELLEKLKAGFGGKFLITKEVKYEVVDRPIGIERFELGALRVKSLIDRGIIELPLSLNISNEQVEKETKSLINIANRSVQIKGKWINIVSKAEISCLALSNELTKKGVKNIIAVDERTTRVLCERPHNLEKLISEKTRRNARVKLQNLSTFSKFRFIRSSEIVYVAYKKDLTKLKGKQALEALLYATKYKGASISRDEIETLKRL